MYVITVDAEKCTGCGSCASNCPVSYLVMNNGKASPEGDECLGCESCIMVCESGAVKLDEY